MSDTPKPIDCECRNWARAFVLASDDLLNHHPTCEHRKNYDGLKEWMIQLVAAIEENGIPDSLWEKYQEARMMAGLPLITKKS